MNWADEHIRKLQAGETATFRPRGHSMAGIIANGQEVRVAPLKPEDRIATGDVVLCQVGARQYLHLVKQVRHDTFLIGNNRGGVNGWIARASIFGRYEK